MSFRRGPSCLCFVKLYPIWMYFMSKFIIILSCGWIGHVWDKSWIFLLLAHKISFKKTDTDIIIWQDICNKWCNIKFNWVHTEDALSHAVSSELLIREALLYVDHRLKNVTGQQKNIRVSIVEDAELSLYMSLQNK